MIQRILIFILAVKAAVVVPPEKEVTQVWVRVGEAKEIVTPPSFPFENIYSKTVFSLDQNNNQRDFSDVCYQTPADIVFTKTFQHNINISKQYQNADIVTTFDEIKADRRILDATLLNDRGYLLLRENKMLIFNLKSNNNKPLSVSVPTQYKNTSIERGFFVQVNTSKLMLVTPSQAFKIQGESIIKISGYQNFTDLESARQLFDNYFAICGISSGIVIYSLEGDSLTKIALLNATFFQRNAIFISDMAYNPDTIQLFVSDEKFGISIVKLDKKQAKLNPKLSNLGYRKFGCNVIVYSEGNLYAACDDLFRVEYASEQVVEMPNPMFKIKELLVYKGLIVAVGQDLISKYYNDKQTEQAPQFDTSERLIFYDNNKYLLANYYAIQSGTFSIKFPAIECWTTNESIQGIVSAVIKTEAQCSTNYLSKYSISLNQSVQKKDRCVYSSPIQIHFWHGEQFNVDVIFIVMGVLFLVAGIITTWAIFIYSKQAYLSRTLQMYRNPNGIELQSSNVIGYQNMVQQRQQKASEVSGEKGDVSETGKYLQEDHKTHSID